MTDHEVDPRNLLAESITVAIEDELIRTVVNAAPHLSEERKRRLTEFMTSEAHESSRRPSYSRLALR